MLSLPWCAAQGNARKALGPGEMFWAPGLDETLQSQGHRLFKSLPVKYSQWNSYSSCWSPSCLLLGSQPSLWFLPKSLDGGGRTLQSCGDFSALSLPHSALLGSQEVLGYGCGSSASSVCWMMTVVRDMPQVSCVTRCPLSPRTSLLSGDAVCWRAYPGGDVWLFLWHMDAAEAKGTVPNSVMERLTAQKARTAQSSLIVSLKYKQSSPECQASEGRGDCRTDVLLLMNNR